MKKLLLVIALFLVAAPLTFANPNYGSNGTEADMAKPEMKADYAPSYDSNKEGLKETAVYDESVKQEYLKDKAGVYDAKNTTSRTRASRRR